MTHPVRALHCAAALLALAANLAAAKGTGLVAVSSEKDNTLTLIDAKTLALVGTLPTCKRPRHMQFMPGRQLLAAACGNSNRVDLIDLAARKTMDSIPVGDDPEAFDLSPDGKTLYVSNEDDGALNVIDVASKRKTKSIPVGQEPEGVKASPDGKRVYVTSEVANMVHVIDTASGTVLKNIPVGKRPRRFALSADGAELWVTNELGASVSIISTRDLAVTQTINFELKGMRPDDITPVGIAPSLDGKTMFVALGRANHVAFVDTATRKVGSLVLVGKRAWNVALDREGARLFVCNGLSDDMTVIDVKEAKPIKTIPVGRVPYAAIVDD
jgi:PQQ-dependent catabolism-associated beta-propeller protein